MARSRLLSRVFMYGHVQEIASILDDENYDDGSIAPLLIRLAWHGSGSYSKANHTGGSNGATIRFAPECEYGANAGGAYRTSNSYIMVVCDLLCACEFFQAWASRVPGWKQ